MFEIGVEMDGLALYMQEVYYSGDCFVRGGSISR